MIDQNPHDAVTLSIHEALVAAGMKVRRLEPSGGWAADDCDFLLARATASPLAWIWKELRRSKSRAPLAVWLSEPMPAPESSESVVRGLGRAYALLDRWLAAAPGLSYRPRRRSAAACFPGGDRVRPIGELFALQELGALKLLCPFSRASARYLRSLGLPAVAIPYGGAPCFGRRSEGKRDLDVLFLGASGDRRRDPIVDRLRRDLEARSISFRHVDGRGGSYVSGAERSGLINRSKILLSVSRRPWDDSVYRFLLAAANGAVLVAEPSRRETEELPIPGQHYVEEPLARLADRIVELLGDDRYRRRLADRAEELIRSKMSMPAMAARLVERLELPK